MNQTEDEFWMREALNEARKSTGLTSPNPAVGAVVVKEGEILSRGRTRKVGKNHAEKDALFKLANGEAKGATIYVTLEPCCTRGRTGACTETIIDSEIARVVYGVADPNPEHQGRADEIFKVAGIQVTSGILEDDCWFQIRGFHRVQTLGRPWVIAKTAMSLDGKISRPPGEGQWLSNAKSREEVQMIRGEVDAIITSGETVRQDDPSLTIRSDRVSADKEQPLRVVLSRQGIGRGEWKIFNDEYARRTLLFQNEELKDVLSKLSINEGVNTVLLECGGNLMGEFFDAELIDEMVIFYAPMVTGGVHSALGGQGIAELAQRWSLKNPSLRQIGNDLCLRGMLTNDSPRLER